MATRIVPFLDGMKVGLGKLADLDSSDVVSQDDVVAIADAAPTPSDITVTV